MAPNRTESHRGICAATTTEERHNLTDHVTPRNQDDGLFRSAGQAAERQPASDVTAIRPSTRPSRNPFHDAVNHEAADHHLTTQRDEATMRSLRFPFDEENRR